MPLRSALRDTLLYLAAASVFLSNLASPFAYLPTVVSHQAPLMSAQNAEPVHQSYIVVFKPTASDAEIGAHFMWLNAAVTAANARDDADNDAFTVRHVYNVDAFRGYSAKLPEHAVDELRQSHIVDYIERDQTVYASSLESNAPWGLARISHRESLSFGTFNKYLYDDIAGSDVTVFVVDTGVNIEHNDFEGRATWGITVPDNDADIDGNGHGTHVAGTIAGKRYGVAKKAKVVAVKVLRSNGSGSMSDVLRGVEWTIAAHRQLVSEAMAAGRVPRNSVANMSLGGGFSKALNTVVNAAVDAGIVYAVAAGNDNRDACDYSPASAEKAITVGATNISDERAYFSNYGKCTDVFAPGRDITSTWIGSRVATNTISGTSMASPHVAGLAAYILSELPLEEFAINAVTPERVKQHVLEHATRDVLDSVPRETPNLLIYNDPPKA